MSNSPLPRRTSSQAEFTEGLLKWVQPIAQSKGLTVRNFQGDWQNGMLFCAILHTYFPHLIDYASLNPENKEQNLQKAFMGFEKVGIQALLDAQDIATYPEKLSILTYLGHLSGKLAGRPKPGSPAPSMAKGIDEIIALGTSTASTPSSPAPVAIERPPLATTETEPAQEILSNGTSHSAEPESILAGETAPLASLTSGRAMPQGRRQPTRAPSGAFVAAPFVPAPISSDTSSTEGLSSSNASSEETSSTEDSQSTGVTEQDNSSTTARPKHPGGFSLFGTFDPSKARVLRAPSKAVGHDEATMGSVEPLTPSSINAVEEAVARAKEEMERKHLDAIRQLRQELAAAQRDADEAKLEVSEVRRLAAEEKAKAADAAAIAQNSTDKQELESVKATNAQLQAQIANLLQTNESIRSQLENANSATIAASSNTTEYETQIAKLNAELDAARAEAKQVSDATVQSLSTKDDEIKMVTQKHNEALEDLRRQLLEAQTKLAEESHRLRTEHETAITGAHKEHSERLEQSKQDSNGEVEKLRLLLAEERAKNASLTIDIQALKGDATTAQEAHKSEIDRMEASLMRQSQAHSEELASTKSSLERLESSVSEITTTHQAELEQERAQLKKDQDALEEDKKRVAEAHAATMEERQSAERATARMEMERTLLEEQKQNAGTTESAVAISGLIESIASIREEIIAVKESSEASHGALVLQNDSLSSKVTVLEKELESAREQLQKAAQFSLEMIVIRTKIRELDTITSTLKTSSASNIEAFTTTIASIHASLKQLEEQANKNNIAQVAQSKWFAANSSFLFDSSSSSAQNALSLESVLAKLVAQAVATSPKPSTSASSSETPRPNLSAELISKVGELELENRKLRLQIDSIASSRITAASSTPTPEEIRTMIRAEVSHLMQQQPAQQVQSAPNAAAPKRHGSMNGRALPAAPTATPSHQDEEARKAQEAQAQAKVKAEVAERERQARVASEEEDRRKAQAAQQAESQRKAEVDRQAEAARHAEVARQAEIARQVEIANQAELSRQEEAARHAEAARQAEALRQQSERDAELARRAEEEARQAEAIKRQQQAELAQQQEAIRLADAAREEANRQAKAQADAAAKQAEMARHEAARKAEAVRQAELTQQAEIARQEAARQAELQAEKARQAEIARHAEVTRQAEIARQEAARHAEAQAEAARQAEIARQETARQAEAARKAEQAAQAEQAKKDEEAKREASIAEAKRLVASSAAPTPAKPVSFFDDVFDFSSPGKKTSAAAATTAKKVSIFDDDDDGFSFPTKKTSTPPAASGTPSAKKSFFDDDDDDDIFKPAAKKATATPQKSFFDRLSSAFN